MFGSNLYNFHILQLFPRSFTNIKVTERKENIPSQFVFRMVSISNICTRLDFVQVATCTG